MNSPQQQGDDSPQQQGDDSPQQQGDDSLEQQGDGLKNPPDNQPDLSNDSIQPGGFYTKFIQDKLDNPNTSREELSTTLEKDKKLKVKIRSFVDDGADLGVAEITLEIEGPGDTPQTLCLTTATHSEPMTSFLTNFKASIEKDAADLTQDDYLVTADGIFSDPRVAELVHMIFDQTIIYEISGENIVWNSPGPAKGSDPLAKLRKIEEVVAGSGISIVPSPDLGDPEPEAVTHTNQTILTNEKIDIPSLTAAVGISKDSITEARTEADDSYTPRSLYSVDPVDVVPGACKEALLSITPEASGTIRLVFKGNNLLGSGPESDADSVIEFTFSTKGVDDTAALEDTIKAILESEQETALTAGQSIADHAAVKNILATLNQDPEPLAITHFSIENALLIGDDSNRGLFAAATLGGTTGLEAALDREILADRPAIRNSIVQGIELGGIAGRIENSILSRLDVRSGHIDIVTDEASRLDKLSAIGATICGTINCPISGDFRRAVLGTESQPLDGAAFGVKEQTLEYKVPSLIRDFIVDTIDTATPPAGMRSTLTINGEAVDLSEFKTNNKYTKRSLDSLKSSSNFYMPDGDSILKVDQFQERMPAYELIDPRNKIISIAEGQYTVQCTYHEPDDAAVLSGSRLMVDLTIATNSSTPSASVVQITGVEAERALYSLKQLDKLSADFEAVKSHHKGAATRVNQTSEIDMAAAAAAAGVANQPTRPSVAPEEVVVLGGTSESD